MNLDDKLREILYECQYGISSVEADDYVAQIHKAFEDAGYTDTGLSKDMIKEAGSMLDDLMTGQEWKKKFMDELHKLEVVRLHTADGSIDSHLLYVSQVEQVAQKVAYDD